GTRVERCADANADQPALFTRFGLLLLPFIPTDQPLRNLHHLGIVPGVVDATIRRGVRKFFRTYIVAYAHFVRRDSQFVRADINNALQEPQMLHPRISAIRTYGALVGHGLAEINASILEAIDARQYL